VLEKFGFEIDSEALICRIEGLLRGRVHRGDLCLGLVLCLLVTEIAEGDELGKLLEELDIDSSRLGGEYRPASLSEAEESTSGGFDQSGLLEVRPGPACAISNGCGSSATTGISPS